jgi:hypothetical protein
MRNPDGSWFEIPASLTRSDPAPRESAERNTPPPVQLSAREHVREFLRGIARKGGKSRAARHSHDEIAAWGRVRRSRKGESEE